MLFLILLLIKKFNRNFGKYFWWNPAAPEGMLNFWTIPNQPPMSIPVPCSACVVISGYRLLWYLTSAGGKDLSNHTEWELFSQPGQKKIARNLLYGFLSPPKNCMHIISRGWVISKLILLSPVQTEATLSANNSQHCWMLHVESVSTPCCMLLRVDVQGLKPVKLFSQQLPTFLLFRDRQSVIQQCWIRLHSSFNIVGATHYSLRIVYNDLWVVSFPRCTVGSNIVGSCCIHLHTTANMDGTTPNIVGATMLGVVASVCTQP